MEVEFEDESLDRLETDLAYTAGLGREVVRGFRKAMQAVRASQDERDLYRGGLRMEKLQGKRQHQHSLRINDQWRLIIEIRESDGRKVIQVMEIADYH